MLPLVGCGELRLVVPQPDYHKASSLTGITLPTPIVARGRRTQKDNENHTNHDNSSSLAPGKQSLAETACRLCCP